MGISILDIAAYAGVSKSTVSAVINNHPNVRPATRECVMQAMRALDYHPNLAARELITARPMNIGIIMPSYRSPDGNNGNKYFNSIDESSNLDLVSRLIGYISKTKYGVLVEHVTISNQEPSLPSFVLSRRVSGIFQIGSLFPSSYIQKIRQYIPSVVDIGALNEDCDSVYTDFVETSSSSVDYLVRAGHRKIAFIGCDPESRTSRFRIQGYVEALKKNGISYNEAWIQNSKFNGIGGYQAFSRIWNSSADKPTAIICATNTIAGGALRFMHENGISVPDDISIVCNADGMLSEFSTPPLTVIGRNKEEIAQHAFSVMMKRMEDSTLPIQHVRTPDHIIERSSVKHIV